MYRYQLSHDLHRRKLLRIPQSALPFIFVSVNVHYCVCQIVYLLFSKLFVFSFPAYICLFSLHKVREYVDELKNKLNLYMHI